MGRPFHIEMGPGQIVEGIIGQVRSRVHFEQLLVVLLRRLELAQIVMSFSSPEQCVGCQFTLGIGAG